MLAVHRAHQPPRQKRPWVARIARRLHPRYGIDRQFLRPMTDYRGARRTMQREMRGVVLEWLLEEGSVYEIHDYDRKDKPARRFVRVRAGEIVEIEREEVIRWISTAST